MIKKLNLKFRHTDVGELHEGIPNWMHASVWKWIFESFKNTNYYGDYSFNLDLALAAERTLRHPIPGLNWNLEYSAEKLAAAFQKGDDVIYLLDFLVQHASSTRIQELKLILEESGSRWTVGEVGAAPAIIERLTPETDAEFAELSPNSVSTDLLIRARKLAYGINPSPTHAYHEAVKAVEVALGSLIEPNNSKATLGTILNVIRGQHWNFSLAHPDHPELLSSLENLCSLLWRGQRDRHGSHDDFEDVSQAESELAVSIALLLVQAARRGHIIRENPMNN